MSAATPASIWTTIRTHLAADKRKTAALGVLSIVMMFVWGRLFLQSSGGPTPAVAALSPELVAAVSTSEVETVRREPDSNEPITREVVRARATPVVDIRKADRTLSRDYFSPDWSQFAAADGGELAASSKQGSPGAWQIVAGSVRRERDRQRREADGVRRKAAELVLQSTMIGEPSLAVISGRMLHVGDTIEGFVVDGIEPRTVVVRKDGVRVTIHMP